ncbi:MAG: hypothetical protein KY428_09965, partial [Bacteroidetes bacterium]|nr:hypothetical protein [Bacteroidota bacterium]
MSQEPDFRDSRIFFCSEQYSNKTINKVLGSNYNPRVLISPPRYVSIIAWSILYIGYRFTHLKERFVKLNFFTMSENKYISTREEQRWCRETMDRIVDLIPNQYTGVAQHRLKKQGIEV